MRSPKNESLLSVRVVGIVMGQSYMFEVVSDYQGEETVVSRGESTSSVRLALVPNMLSS